MDRGYETPSDGEEVFDYEPNDEETDTQDVLLNKPDVKEEGYEPPDNGNNDSDDSPEELATTDATDSNGTTVELSEYISKLEWKFNEIEPTEEEEFIGNPPLDV